MPPGYELKTKSSASKGPNVWWQGSRPIDVSSAHRPNPTLAGASLTANWRGSEDPRRHFFSGRWESTSTSEVEGSNSESAWAGPAAKANAAWRCGKAQSLQDGHRTDCRAWLRGDDTTRRGGPSGRQRRPSLPLRSEQACGDPCAIRRALRQIRLSRGGNEDRQVARPVHVRTLHEFAGSEPSSEHPRRSGSGADRRRE